MAAQTYYVLFKNGRVTTVAGVQDITVVHEVNYDNSNYRDDLTGGQGIDSHALLITETAFSLVTPPSGTPLVSPSIVSWTNATPATQWKTLSDQASHIPPRNESKQRSRFKFWSGASASGDVLFTGWCDRIEGISITTWTSVN